ncbi:DUF3726 domain-containing protein [Stagnihabitans tardus]|uniref:DUF3726 domain-containing protein n=1 Tax=Stagnihabitans tardus TaxID=2699202 RepID=A0AAE4YAL7_9RHOB|nr:DUF3726 domain-containing protein [Stagnihabitans tardus]NBZ89128.1 DUF3726 domain-containing protein [Stagnihabitans tardus]
MTALSQNEIESLALRAARGAGFSWGLAEEAGLALGWLAARGHDGTGALLDLLNAGPLARPLPGPGRWQAQGQGPLCPITLGAALLDHARLAEGPLAGPLDLPPVAAPVLLVPFLARLADLGGTALKIEAPGLGFVMAPRVGGPLPVLATTPLALRIVPLAAALPLFDPAILDALGLYALRTTVPATETSRGGAGSATPDSD